MDKIPLQISTHTELLSGGYGRVNGAPMYGGCTNCFSGVCDLVEMVDRSCGYFYDNPVWEDVGPSGERTRTYYWRDSNVATANGLNSRSSEGYTTIKDVWSATGPDEENNLVITHDMYVVAWGRQDFVGSPNPYPARSLACYRAVNGNYELKAELGTHPINFEYHDTGDIYIGRFTYVIPPQTSSRGKYPRTGTLIRNWVTGMASSNPYGGEAEYLVDMMLMGADFKNNLPNQFDPPKMRGIVQTPDICEDYVIVDIDFEESNLTGADLEFQYWYTGETEADARTLWVTDVKAHQPIHLHFFPVYPSRNHDMHLYWRARFVSRRSALKDSNWTYGDFETLFIPPPNMSVPDISDAECAAIVRGELIPPYEELTWYGKE